ncbi:hypothetical protein [Acinetobacter sp. NS-4]|uniref:hypothetical protein n=1 Tax=Acinetobacter sp. NS-4 TaxID=3127956 RepID=UPI00307DC9AB
MTYIRHTLLGLCLATSSLAVFAQGTDEHKEHHPAGSTSTATVNKTATGSPTTNPMAAMDLHMKAMQTMHEKMMAAKKPADRQKLMAEHQKLMQDGMSMMQKMDQQNMNMNMADRQQMMEKRMDMMQSMMQMMMDGCMSQPAAKK